MSTELKNVLVINLRGPEDVHDIQVLGADVRIQRISCQGDVDRARQLIREWDGRVDAIGLDGLPAYLQLGQALSEHEIGREVRTHGTVTPVVDGHGIRSSLERWGVILANQAEPGIFAHKSVLMVPGLNHSGLAQALGRRAGEIRYADPQIYFRLPRFPGVGSRYTLDQAAPSTLESLRELDFHHLRPAATPQESGGHEPLFQWADVLAGDADTICRYAPDKLHNKTVVVEHAAPRHVEDLQDRGASILVTMMPSLGDSADSGALARFSAAAVEAVLVALESDTVPTPRPDSRPERRPGTRPEKGRGLSEDSYLNLIADLDWKPAVRYLQRESAGINRFAFVIHPLDVSFIHKHPKFRWTRALPNALVERVAAFMPPMYISRITGGVSPATGQRIEGFLYSLAATPREMMRHGPRFTYERLEKIARMAERHGARIMGLGAFTSVVGDAGATVAHESDIAVTSGNSLTVVATLEAAKEAMAKMGKPDLSEVRAMVVGATGSIGSVCSRLIAEWTGNVILVSIEPERLIELKNRIRRDNPGCRVEIGTKTADYLPDCDLIISATSAFGQRVIEISKCKPGAVICDVARPPDITLADAATRPDVLVIEGGEVLIPGDIDFGYDIGLPPKVAYACLAETALLAMDGKFVDFTIGRELKMSRIKEIYDLFKTHRFEIAGLRSLGRWVTDKQVEEQRRLADELRADPDLLERTVAKATRKLATIPIQSKGVKAVRREPGRARTWVAHALGRLGRKFALRSGK
jgi:predicted amino acid dehydrogenase